MGSIFLDDFSIPTNNNFAYETDQENMFINQNLEQIEESIYPDPEALLSNNVSYDDNLEVNENIENGTDQTDLFSASPISSEDRLLSYPDSYILPATRKMSYQIEQVHDVSADFIDMNDDMRSARILTIRDLLTLKPTDFEFDLITTKQLNKRKYDMLDFEADYLQHVDDITKISPNINETNDFHTNISNRHYVKRTLSDAIEIGYESAAIVCDKCLNCFRSLNAYRRHDEFHRENKDCPLFTLICPIEECNIRCDCLQTIVEHVRISHGRRDLIFETFEFRDVQHYEKWRCEMEDITQSTFTQANSVKRRKGTNSRIRRYQCSFSGKARTYTTSRSRMRTSKKMNRHCTSFFTVESRQDGTYCVSGCFKHVGHDTTISKIPLNSKIRKEIASFLLEGMNEQQICDLMKKRSTVNDRRHYIQVYEVKNVSMKLMRGIRNQEKEEENVEEKEEDNEEKQSEKDSKESKDAEKLKRENENEIFDIVPHFVAKEEIVSSLILNNI